MLFSDIRDELLSLCGGVRPPVTTEALTAFQTRFKVRLPEELTAAYSLMNGADHSTNPERSWIRFWPIEEWASAKGRLPPGSAEGDEIRLFVFADYGIECVYYAMDLQPQSEAFGHVYALGATRIVGTAKSFSKFVQMVLADSNDLHTYS